MPCLAQEKPSEPASQIPLSPEEIREGALRVEELILAWKETELLHEAMAKEQEFAERERQLAARELDAEKQRTAIAEKETAIQKDKAIFYEQAFKEATKGRSFGCVIAKVFTIGLARCR